MTQETLLKYLLRIVPSVVRRYQEKIVDSRAQLGMEKRSIPPFFFGGGGEWMDDLYSSSKAIA